MIADRLGTVPPEIVPWGPKIQILLFLRRSPKTLNRYYRFWDLENITGNNCVPQGQGAIKF